jgi:MFS family permease
VETGSLLRNKDFLILWATGASYGTLRWLEILGLALFTFDQTQSPLAVAGMMFLRMLPMILFGSVIGAVADRFDRKRLLVGGIVCLGLLASTLAMLATFDLLRLWVLACAVFVSGIFFTGDLTIRRTLLGEVAGTHRLGRALALDSATSNATRMLGPLTGGIVYGWLGMQGIYIIAATVYVLVVAMVLRLGARPPRAVHDRESFVHSIVAAFRYVRSEPRILATLSVTVIINVWAFPVATMVPVIGRETFELSASWVGFLASAEGTGAFLGALALSWFIRPAFYLRAYVAGSCVFLLAIVVFALMPDLYAAWPALCVGGLGVAGFAAMQPTLIMAFTDPAYRSRIMGLLTVCIGTGPIGILHVGLMAEWLGPTTAVLVMGLEGLLVLGFVVWHWPTLRQVGI